MTLPGRLPHGAATERRTLWEQLLDVRLERKPTLLDYLAGGGTIKLLAALDFSCSNEPQNSSGSMHQAAPGPVSACEQVVCAFASALQVSNRAEITLKYAGRQGANGTGAGTLSEQLLPGSETLPHLGAGKTREVYGPLSVAVLSGSALHADTGT